LKNNDLKDLVVILKRWEKIINLFNTIYEEARFEIKNEIPAFLKTLKLQNLRDPQYIALKEEDITQKELNNVDEIEESVKQYIRLVNGGSMSAEHHNELKLNEFNLRVGLHKLTSFERLQYLYNLVYYYLIPSMYSYRNHNEIEKRFTKTIQAFLGCDLIGSQEIWQKKAFEINHPKLGEIKKEKKIDKQLYYMLQLYLKTLLEKSIISEVTYKRYYKFTKKYNMRSWELFNIIYKIEEGAWTQEEIKQYHKMVLKDSMGLKVLSKIKSLKDLAIIKDRQEKI